MIDIPADLSTRFDAVLSGGNIPTTYHAFYRKWLRYYLDFCHKYDLPHSDGESLKQFIKKLQDKNQSPTQQKQAHHAVPLYYAVLKDGVEGTTVAVPSPTGAPLMISEPSGRYSPLSPKGQVREEPKTEDNSKQILDKVAT